MSDDAKPCAACGGSSDGQLTPDQTSYHVCVPCWNTAAWAKKVLGWNWTRFITWAQAERGQSTFTRPNADVWMGRGPS